MSTTGQQIKTAIVIAGLVLLSGIAILLLWFLGPVWLSPVIKIVITALVLLCWPIGLLIVYYRRKSRTVQQLPNGGKAPATPGRSNGRRELSAPTGQYDELERGAEETVQWLRSTRLGDVNSSEVVYKLPWFVIAGPTGGGKTSFLSSSALNFQVLPSQRASEHGIIRPTDGSDWRVSDSAILLDTGGRYQSEGHNDRDEWSALLETVKKYRREHPVDGYVLAVNALAVARWSETEIEQQAKVLRARLDEAMLRSGARFPVYLVFTHMDEIDGFEEFFASFTPEERSQIWGSTIPLAQAENAQQYFDAEFEHLYGRLIRRRTVQLATTSASIQQLRIFKFPGRFRRLRSQLGSFASAVFRPNPFSESPLLRGFYFTGTPAAGAGNGRRLTGEEFFSNQLLSRVVLPDQNIAAANSSVGRSPNLWRYALLALGTVVLLVFLVGMFVSFVNNRALIADADARGKKLTEIRKVTSRGTSGRGSVAEELQAVEGVRQVLNALNDYEQNGPPPGLRFGLYTGGKINSSDPNDPSILRHLYFEAIEERFLKPTMVKVEQELRTFGAGAPRARSSSSQQGADGASEEEYLGRHYDLLKAYMMLNQPERVEPMFLSSTLRDYWVASAPPGMEDLALEQLDYFAGQANKEDAPHPETDSGLISQAQDKLVAYPVVNRVYKRMTSDINAAVKYPVNLSTIPDARDGNILNGSYSVPGSYTIDGYLLMNDKLQSSAADEFRKDDWVMKAGNAPDTNLDVKKDELANMYYRDYVAQWQKFLQEIKVRDYESKEDAVRALRVLSGSNSPLDSVMREVARQTTLSNAGASGAWGWIKSLFSRVTNTAGSTQVEREFKPLIQFMTGKADSAPATEYRTQLKKIDDALASNARPLPEISKALQAGNDTIGLRPARQAVNDSLESRGFSSTPAADAAARVLRQPLDNLNTLLVGTDFAQIERQWQSLYQRASAFESGFPFADASSDASVASLAQFLNPQDGELTRYFNERLKPYFEDDWSIKKESSDKFSPEFVRYLAGARRLRDALFPDGGKQPRSEYQIAVAPAANALIKVDIDGSTISAPEKPTANFVWPGDKSGVKITITPLSGQDLTRSFPGEWGLLRMVNQSGGAAANSPEIRLQPQVGTSSAKIAIQPKSGNPFRRELFTGLKAPRSATQNQ